MTTYLWLSKNSMRRAKIGQTVYFGSRGKLVINLRRALLPHPIGIIRELPGDGSALVEINLEHPIYQS